MRVGGQWMYSEEGWSGDNDPTWLGIGYMVGDLGLLVLLLTTGFAFWWSRSKKPVAGRIVAGLSLVYLVLLGVAWLAMSGKWGRSPSRPLTKALRQQGEFPRKRGIGSAQ